MADSEYYFDEHAADKAVAFLETHIRHTKGEKAGQLFVLEDWQRDNIIRPLFGWKRKSDGLRKYRTCYIEIPRKNGKSTLCAGLANLLLFADGENGAEVYSAAGDRGQAGIVFDVAKHMVLQDPELSKRGKTYRSSITYEAKGSKYQALSADADTKHGFNSHGVVFDELHTQPDRELWDVLTTSVGARRQPLIIAITTAGYDRNSICWEIHDYAVKVRDGIIEDETFLPVLYFADEEDDWLSEETWKKANPAYGTIIKEDYFKQQAEKARTMPSYENTFKRLHLNMWTRSESRWISDEDWMVCDKGVPNMEKLKELPCYGGLDLASTRDITAFVLIFPDGDLVHVLPFFFIPEDNAYKRTDRDGVDYLKWINQGHVISTQGNVTDYEVVRKKINELADIYQIKSIAFDRWNSSQLVSNLVDDGANMKPFGQGYASMSAPVKALETKILSGNLNHWGNPVMRWMASNIQIEESAAGDIKFNKKKSKEKIDGMVGLAMAMGQWIGDKKGSYSIYESRGIITF